MNKFSEKDWKLFRNKISDWQEAYMEKLDKEYIVLLSGEGNASDKFWKLEKRIREDKKDCGVQREMSRSNQFYCNRYGWQCRVEYIYINKVERNQMNIRVNEDKIIYGCIKMVYIGGQYCNMSLLSSVSVMDSSRDQKRFNFLACF